MVYSIVHVIITSLAHEIVPAELRLYDTAAVLDAVVPEKLIPDTVAVFPSISIAEAVILIVLQRCEHLK